MATFARRTANPHHPTRPAPPNPRPSHSKKDGEYRGHELFQRRNSRQTEFHQFLFYFAVAGLLQRSTWRERTHVVALLFGFYRTKLDDYMKMRTRNICS